MPEVSEHAIERAMERFGCPSAAAAKKMILSIYVRGRETRLETGPIRHLLGMAVGITTRRDGSQVITTAYQLDSPGKVSAGENVGMPLKPSAFRNVLRSSKRMQAKLAAKQRKRRGRKQRWKPSEEDGPLYNKMLRAVREAGGTTGAGGTPFQEGDLLPL